MITDLRKPSNNILVRMNSSSSSEGACIIEGLPEFAAAAALPVVGGTTCAFGAIPALVDSKMRKKGGFDLFL